MVLGRPRKSINRDTKQSILVAALELYSRNGYEATSIRQLSKAVGVRESAIYVHFKNKQHILQILMETYGPGRDVQAFVDLKASKGSLDYKNSLLTVVETMIDHWCEPEEIMFYRLMMSESLRGSSSFREESKVIVDQVRAQIRNFFSQLIENSPLKDLGIDFVEAEFIGPMMFMRQQTLLMNEVPGHRDILKTFARQHIDFLFNSLLRVIP